MNLLYLTFAYLPATGGAERSVYNLSAELSARGHSVLVACNGDGIVDYDGSSHVPSVRLRIPTAFRWSTRDRIAGGIRDAFNVSVLAAICIQRRIEIVHCHLINMDTRYAFALRHFLGVKVVVTLRGGEMGHWIVNRPYREAYVREAIETADILTALSETQIVDAARLTGERLPEVTAVIPNPLRPRLAAIAAGETPSRPYLIYAGRLAREKAVDVLIGAYHRLVAAESHYPLDLVIAGDGSESRMLRRLAAEGPGAARIRFLGERPYAHALELIRRATLLVLPTQQEEGCPNVLMEAMALQVPVVVSAMPSVLELVEHGVNGEAFPPGDQQALRAILSRLARDPERRSRYAAGGLRHLENRHRMDRIVDRYESLYRRLLGGPA